MWNQLPQEEREYVVLYALEHQALSSREIATRLVDVERRFVSESTVYRLLRKAGLIKPPETRGFPASRMILEWKIQTSMSSPELIEVVRRSVEWIKNRTV